MAEGMRSPSRSLYGGALHSSLGAGSSGLGLSSSGSSLSAQQAGKKDRNKGAGVKGKRSAHAGGGRWHVAGCTDSWLPLRAKLPPRAHPASSPSPPPPLRQASAAAAGRQRATVSRRGGAALSSATRLRHPAPVPGGGTSWGRRLPAARPSDLGVARHGLGQGRLQPLKLGEDVGAAAGLRCDPFLRREAGAGEAGVRGRQVPAAATQGRRWRASSTCLREVNRRPLLQMWGARRGGAAGVSACATQQLQVRGGRAIARHSTHLLRLGLGIGRNHLHAQRPAEAAAYQRV